MAQSSSIRDCKNMSRNQEPPAQSSFSQRHIITGRNEVVDEVMFLLVSVILLTEGVCLSACWDTTTPLEADPPGRRHPPGGRPPQKEVPPPGIRSMSGRYASYWNAYLLAIIPILTSETLLHENKTFQYSHFCQFRLVCEKVERQSRLPNAINQCFTNSTSTTSTVWDQQMKCVDIVCFKGFSLSQPKPQPASASATSASATMYFFQLPVNKKKSKPKN